MVLAESEFTLASFLFTRTFGRILTKYINTVVPNGKPRPSSSLYRGADRSLARPWKEDQNLQHYTKTYGVQTTEIHFCFLYAISLGIML